MVAPTWLPIVMYHRILERGGQSGADPYSVSVDLLEAQLDWFASHSFAPVPLDLALQVPAPGETRRFAVTFDDGYADCLELALPVLRSRGVPATVFVVSKAVGGHADWDGGAAILSRDGLRELHSEGVFIGSHGRTHRRLAGLPRHELESEVWGSKSDLEDLLGTAVRHFAYPHHSFDRDVVEVVRDGGYDGAAGGHEATHDRFNLHRIDAVKIGRPSLALRIRGVHRRARRLPVPPPVRKLLGAAIT
ncbi:MAG TPA: polysaccharide deacetylase family protein [Candidatus Dormibacteraeota bacterium]|jgi:peptidoglycan/xylan/chitin deacetylase (PgdA/CDA1 family)